MSEGTRRDELAERLAEVRARIVAAATPVGERDVTLVVVTKTWPANDIRLLHELGVSDVGENRHQEAEPKVSELAGLDLRWHFVGQVQSNKAAAIAGYADVVHSVDSVRVVRRLDSGAERHHRVVDCFVQVDLGQDTEAHGHRGGVRPTDVEEIAAAVDAAASLRLIGVMGVAPIGEEPAEAFERLAAVRARLGEHYPTATAMSAGMTGDFEAAIAAGATHVRVGSAILGSRPALR